MKKDIWKDVQERRENGDPSIKGGNYRDVKIKLNQFVKNGILYEQEVKNYKGHK